MLKDAGNVVANQFGAERTPEVFVLDSERRVRYHERIDDQYNYGVQKPKADQLLLAKYAASSDVVVNADISKLNAPDFRLLSRRFSSSVHVPVKLDGKPGVISFWSTESNAFSPVAVDLLRKVAAGIRN